MLLEHFSGSAAAIREEDTRWKKDTRNSNGVILCHWHHSCEQVYLMVVSKPGREDIQLATGCKIKRTQQRVRGKTSKRSTLIVAGVIFIIMCMVVAS